MKGLKILVTGATGGLGELLSEQLVREGAHVLVHGRDRVRVEALAKKVGGTPIVADFASLATTAAVARASSSIDVLINNAGIGFGSDSRKREVSSDGFELRFAVNYLSPFVLTYALLASAKLQAIVNVASAGQEPLDFEDLDNTRAYDGMDAYRRSKLAMVMMSFDLAATSQVPTDALHPGTFLDTGMVREAGLTPQGTARSGADAIFAMTKRALAGETGTYYNVDRLARANEQAYDEHARRRLRDKTRELVAPYL